MKPNKPLPLPQEAAEWSVDTFSAHVLKVLKGRFSGTTGPVDEVEVKRWVERWWPLPQEAVLSVVHWARAFVDDRGASCRVQSDDKDGEKNK